MTRGASSGRGLRGNDPEGEARNSSELVQRLWARGIDSTSVTVVSRLEESGQLRKLPVGWWLTHAGWCPTFAVLERALLRRGYIRMFVEPKTEGHR